jgi:hypothetical protein
MVSTKPQGGPSQAGWLRVAAVVNHNVRKLGVEHLAGFEVDAKNCYDRFLAVCAKADPTGGADSDNPEVKQIGILKELRSEIDALQASTLARLGTAGSVRNRLFFCCVTGRDRTTEEICLEGLCFQSVRPAPASGHGASL